MYPYTFTVVFKNSLYTNSDNGVVYSCIAMYNCTQTLEYRVGMKYRSNTHFILITIECLKPETKQTNLHYFDSFILFESYSELYIFGCHRDHIIWGKKVKYAFRAKKAKPQMNVCHDQTQKY